MEIICNGFDNATFSHTYNTITKLKYQDFEFLLALDKEKYYHVLTPRNNDISVSLVVQQEDLDDRKIDTVYVHKMNTYNQLLGPVERRGTWMVEFVIRLAKFISQDVKCIDIIDGSSVKVHNTRQPLRFIRAFQGKEGWYELFGFQCLDTNVTSSMTNVYEKKIKELKFCKKAIVWVFATDKAIKTVETLISLDSEVCIITMLNKLFETERYETVGEYMGEILSSRPDIFDDALMILRFSDLYRDFGNLEDCEMRLEFRS